MTQKHQFDSAATAVIGAELSVKAAAATLGVSKSTVYRMNRVNGPFAFFRRGRRVFVDASSFDLYLQAKTRTSNPGRTVSIDSFTKPEAPSDGVSLQPIAYSPEAKGGRTSRTGTGQRELVIPERRGPFVVVFVAW